MVPEYCSDRCPPGIPKVVPPDCPFDILSASSSGSARRLLIVSGLTGCVENAQVAGAPDRKTTSPATAISILFIGAPLITIVIVGFRAGSVIPNEAHRPTGALEDGAAGFGRTRTSPDHSIASALLPSPGGAFDKHRPMRFPSSVLSRRKKNPSTISRSRVFASAAESRTVVGGGSRVSKARRTIATVAKWRDRAAWVGRAPAEGIRGEG